MTEVVKPKRRRAEGWPDGWYYSDETANLEAMLDPDGYFNRVILGRDVKPRPAASEDRQPGSDAVPPPEAKV